MASEVSVPVESLRYGDIIIEGTKKIPVRTMGVCGSRFGNRNKLHINDDSCYDRGTMVNAVIADV